MVETPTPQFCEFELRLGRNVDGSFVTGVDAIFAGALLCKLETSTVWTEKTPWTQIVDRFFLLPSGLQVRTSSQPVPRDVFMLKKSTAAGGLGCSRLRPEVEESDDDIDDDMDDNDDSESESVPPRGGGGGGAVVASGLGLGSTGAAGDEADTDVAVDYLYETSHVIKTAIAHADLRWVHTEGVEDFLVGREGNVFNVRVGLKQEVPVFEDELQECVEETNTVRIKQRRSFKYTPAGKDRVQWAIEITQVWQAACYTDAMECLRRGDEPRYEVEIECLEPFEYLKELKQDTKRLALSMLLKAADLFSVHHGMPCQLVPL
jgi:hypothetical protein